MADTDRSEQLSARELAERGDTTVRTVHYYVSEGLLPPPEGATRSAVYGGAHLARLRIISALRSEGLSLAAIRSRMDQLSDEDVAAVLQTLQRFDDEIRAGEVTVLGFIEAAVVQQASEPEALPYMTRDAPPMLSAPPPEPAAHPDSARAYVDRILRRESTPQSIQRQRESHVLPKQRPETWHHFTIEDGIEIRVREDRLRPERRQVETFIDSVRDTARRSFRRRNS